MNELARLVHEFGLSTTMSIWIMWLVTTVLRDLRKDVADMLVLVRAKALVEAAEKPEQPKLGGPLG